MKHLKTNSLNLIIAISLLFLPIKTLAWGEKGHQLVAEIAFNQLDAPTKKLLMTYLDGMTIEKAATWMDDIKKNPAYDKLKPLHYVNFDKNTQVKDSCCDNIIHALTLTINDLKNYKNFSKEEVKIKLCYLFHLIGDLHQPLHVGYGNDKGGNQFQVQFNGKGTNLHSLFDYGIIEYKELSLEQYSNEQQYSTSQIKAIQSGTVVDWAKESRSYLNAIYMVNNRQIDANYVDVNFVLIKSQLHKSGIRLAGLLNTIFNS